MPLSLGPFRGKTSAARRGFFDQAWQAVIASQKIAGKFTTIDEIYGYGSVINFLPGSERHGGPGTGGGPGACCNPITFGCTILSQSACTGAGGVYLGQGTTCSPIDPCAGGGFQVGACCHGAVCSITTRSFCGSTGGYFRGAGTGCGGGACTGADQPGACCDGFGGCTYVPLGGCGGVGWHGGLGCDSGVCGPVEPTGACCAGPTSTCAVTTFAGCGGLFHEGVSCEFVGSCEHDFCGPTNSWCACPPTPFGGQGDPRCLPTLQSPPCTGNIHQCVTCAVPGVPGSFCCCACCDTAFGPACTFCGG